MKFTRKKAKSGTGTDNSLKSKPNLNPEPPPRVPKRISTFICVTNPLRRGDTFIEAIKSHLLFSDELVVVDGGSTDRSLYQIRKLNDPRIRIVTLPWSQENWSWAEFATHWNYGYENCTGDWVAAGETDHIWHENDAARVREFLNMAMTDDLAVVACEKFQTATVDTGFNKSGFPYFLNKAKFGDSIGYGHDPNCYSDLAAPIYKEKELYPLFYEGVLIKDDRMKKFRISFINYIWTFKTADMILREREAGLKAWKAFFKDSYSYPAGRNMDDIKKELERSYLRLERCVKPMAIEDHPEVIREKLIKELKPGMFGYDFCGWNNGYSIPENYFEPKPEPESIPAMEPMETDG